jgi:hypothetical protein
MGLKYCRSCCLVVMMTWLTVPSCGRAQQIKSLMDDVATAASDDLPNAPSTQSNKTTSSSLFGVDARNTTGEPAKKFHRVIQPNESGVSLSGGEKLELSVMSRLTLTGAASTLFSAGWSHIRDSDPHFGTDSGAFGERLGAAAIKETTESIFSYGIYASMFHDDPRYYVMGRQKKITVRAIYAASRVVVTQKDNGRAAINWPDFAGIASATALTNAYYPSRDHGFSNGAESFAVSLGTSALSNELDEFLDDALRLVRHNRK